MPRRRCRTRDHPRMRGEHNATLSILEATAGSSPHARGALGLVYAVVALWGIIPACAGSTCAADAYIAVDGDHPRMRGEHPLKMYWS